MSKNDLIKRECIYCEDGVREEVLRKTESITGCNGEIKTNLVIFESKCCGGGRSMMPLGLAEKGALNVN